MYESVNSLNKEEPLSLRSRIKSTTFHRGWVIAFISNRSVLLTESYLVLHDAQQEMRSDARCAAEVQQSAGRSKSPHLAIPSRLDPIGKVVPKSILEFIPCFRNTAYYSLAVRWRFMYTYESTALPLLIKALLLLLSSNCYSRSS